MSKARNWSLTKTSLITAMCGLGHVGSSIALGFIGIALGIGLSKLEIFEGVRGSLAGWAFIIFGLGYLIWAIWKKLKNKPHEHQHIHSDGTVHMHTHNHKGEHMHAHKKKVTPWILFTIFLLGPCEPLIPFLMYPAAKSSVGGVVFVSSIFAITTIATMLVVVITASFGIKMVNFGKMEKYVHVIAGATILLSGIGMQFLGL
jgi:sulfite exporter TauE/SafE